MQQRAASIGDTFVTNAMLDNVLVSPDGFCDAGTKVYANGHDLKDPLLSPVYGDVAGFPPTILTSGTRDLLLSNTVRMHRKLRQAGVEAVLQVFEGSRTRNFIATTRRRSPRKLSRKSPHSSTSTWGNDGVDRSNLCVAAVAPSQADLALPTYGR